MLDPNDFVITRKRKRYRFAKFYNSPLCFEFDEWHTEPIDVVEIGAGTGLFSVELAEMHPEHSFLAIDVKADRLQKGAYEAQSRGLSNIQFLRARADQLAECVEPSSVTSLWLTFPDPLPKKGASARRLTHPKFLKLFAASLAINGQLQLKHDNTNFFQWSLEQLVGSGWHIDELSFDLHDSDIVEECKTMTSFEKRWTAEGSTINFVRALHDKSKITNR